MRAVLRGEAREKMNTEGSPSDEDNAAYLKVNKADLCRSQSTNYFA